MPLGVPTAHRRLLGPGQLPNRLPLTELKLPHAAVVIGVPQLTEVRRHSL
jgi:hypothetical protein